MHERFAKKDARTGFVEPTTVATGTIKMSPSKDGAVAYLIDFVLHSYQPPQIKRPPFQSFTARGGHVEVLAVRDAATNDEVRPHVREEIEDRHRQMIHEGALAEVTCQAIQAFEIISSN